jgi:Icc-related predicted phosphoesterase
MNFLKNSIQYVSDLHIEKGFKRYVTPQKPFLILAGDIGYPSYVEYKNFLINTSYNFDKVFVISGNHEYDLCNVNRLYEVDDEIENICMLRNNIFYMQKKKYVLCEKEKIVLAGCTFWSKLPKSKYKYHIEHKEWIENTIEDENNYIIATHHCPLFQCLNRTYDNLIPNYFATNQSNILKKDNVIAWIHGHSHINNDFNIYGKWILSNQYGSFKNPIKNFKS